jgi:hypothetical protein
MTDAIIKHRSNDTDMVVVVVLSALRWLLCTKKGFEWGGVGKRGHTVSNVPNITGIDALY